MRMHLSNRLKKSLMPVFLEAEKGDTGMMFP